MKHLIVILLWLNAPVSHSNLSTKFQPENIVGVYFTPKKDGKIEVYKKDGKYYGKTIAADKPRKDIYNPNPSLRNRNIIGLVFLNDFVFEDGKYIDGTIYDPDNGKTYSCKMWLENGNLYARGYIGVSLLGRTEIFEKVK